MLSDRSFQRPYRSKADQLVNALAGRVAGVQITNGSSGVGSSSRIVIRGENSLTGSNQPLFVIDGVPISNNPVTNNTENNETGFQEVDYGNGAADISPDDIESISVLKGAAAALYMAAGLLRVLLSSTQKMVLPKKAKASVSIALLRLKHR
jgi:outer membrane receptor for ferrienterochelin and colicin